MTCILQLWEKPGSIPSAPYLAAADPHEFSSSGRGQVPSSHHTLLFFPSRNEIAFILGSSYTGLPVLVPTLVLVALQDWHTRTVLYLPKLETLHAGRKPAGDASSPAGKLAPVSPQAWASLCEQEAPGKPMSRGPSCLKGCLSPKAAGPTSFLCLKICLQLVQPELSWS